MIGVFLGRLGCCGYRASRGFWLARERDLAMTYHSIGSLYVWDEGGRAEHNQASAQPGQARWRQFLVAGRAVIGDELRAVAAWCELGECIARYSDSGALGHADVVARALASGWCKDGFGRLVCPSCQQRFPIWSSAPLVPRTHVPARRFSSPKRYIGEHRARAPAGRPGGGLRSTAPAEPEDRR